MLEAISRRRLAGGSNTDREPEVPQHRFSFRRSCLSSRPWEHASCRAAILPSATTRPRPAWSSSTETLAQHLVAERDPVGKRLVLPGDPMKVVGVAGEMRVVDHQPTPIGPLVFYPLAQHFQGKLSPSSRAPEWIRSKSPSSVKQDRRPAGPRYAGLERAHSWISR